VIPTDTELIARTLANDDRTAFGQLVQRHQSAVRNFLRHLTHNDAALADDLAQETFIQAYRGLRNFRGTASFSTWLFGIAHNFHRNAHRRRRDFAPIEEVDQSGPSTPSEIPNSDLRHDLTAALRELSDDERLALHLGFEQGLSHAEISTLLHWPLGTVKTHLARGKEKLRPLLAVWNPNL
jgi:RNA polymerase sigma-70 factor (ECF subfamily)